MAYKVFNWNNANFKWNNNPYTWNEVELAQKLIQGATDEYNLWSDFEKKKLVKLILKVHGNTITESKRKEIKQYKIKASDIKITVEKVLGVELMTENIKF